MLLSISSIPVDTPRLFVILAVVFSSLVGSVAPAYSEDEIATEGSSWEALASFYVNPYTFGSVNKSVGMLAYVYEDMTIYCDAYSGVTQFVHRHLGARVACVNPDRSQLILCRDFNKDFAKIDFVRFGSGFVHRSIFLPVSLFTTPIANLLLLKVTDDGKYLILEVYLEGTNKIGPRHGYVIWNLDGNEVELSLETMTDSGRPHEFDYDPQSQTLAIQHHEKSNGVIDLVNISTGSKRSFPADIRMVSFEFFDGRLLEFSRYEVNEIDLVTGERNLIAQSHRLDNWNFGCFDNHFWSGVLRQGKSGGQAQDRVYFLPQNPSYDKFLGIVRQLSENDVLPEGSDLYPTPVEISSSEADGNCITDTARTFCAVRGYTFGTPSTVWMKVPRDNSGSSTLTDSEIDCRDLMRLWRLGCELKTKDWFANKGSARRNRWQADYEKKCPFAASLLGLSLAVGGDGVKSLDKGKRLLRESIDRGFLDAAVWLALFEKDPQEAFRLLSKASESGSAFSMESLARCYRFGVGCEEDLAIAFKLSLKASELDHGGLSALSVGRSFEHGVGTASDPDKAFSYFQKAADSRAMDSEYYLAMCYLNGVGVAPSNKDAFEWLQVGMSTGSVMAKYGMGLCLENGVNCDKNILGARDLYNECANLGVKKAHEALARIKTEVEAAERAQREGLINLSQHAAARNAVRTRLESSTQAGRQIYDDVREAMRDYRYNVAGELGVNGVIFVGGY